MVVMTRARVAAGAVVAEAEEAGLGGGLSIRLRFGEGGPEDTRSRLIVVVADGDGEPIGGEGGDRTRAELFFEVVVFTPGKGGRARAGDGGTSGRSILASDHEVYALHVDLVR